MIIPPSNTPCKRKISNLFNEKNDKDIDYNNDTENEQYIFKSYIKLNSNKSAYYNTRKYYNRVIGLFSDK